MKYIRIRITENDDELFEGITDKSYPEIEQIILSQIDYLELELDYKIYLTEKPKSLNVIEEYCENNDIFYSMDYYKINEY